MFPAPPRRLAEYYTQKQEQDLQVEPSPEALCDMLATSCKAMHHETTPSMSGRHLLGMTIQGCDLHSMFGFGNHEPRHSQCVMSLRRQRQHTVLPDDKLTHRNSSASRRTKICKPTFPSKWSTTADTTYHDSQGRRFSSGALHKSPKGVRYTFG